MTEPAATTESAVALWSAATLASLSGADLDGSVTGPISGISIDTRSLQRGDLFVALRDQRDGHDFVTAACKAGASAALVARTYHRKPGDGLLIRAADPLRALEDIARIARFRTDAQVVAVTGSVGKTGTKEMLRLCLAHAGATHASEKSYNNHWGVPLTLARMPVSTRYGVFEIGMNHPGEITPLVRMVAPDVGIITTVEAVHLAHFNSIAEIAEAKAELLLGLPAGGTAILNRDNAFFELLRRRATDRNLRVVSFGGYADADVRLATMVAADAGAAITAHVHGRRLDYALGAPGRHYAMNSLAVIAAIVALGANLDVCVPALATVNAPPGRGARSTITLRDGGTALLIDESYNANPASMAAALANLGAVPRGTFPRRLAILGDMRELGADADRLHRSLAGAIEAAGVDTVFACGAHMRALFDAVPQSRRGGWAATSHDLVAGVAAAITAGDAVMIKGSLGTHMAPLLKAVRDLGADQA